MSYNPVVVNKVNNDPTGKKVIAALGGSEQAYQTAYIIISNPSLTDAIKTVKGFDTDAAAWADFMPSWVIKSGSGGTWWDDGGYMNDISSKYSEISGRTQTWKQQSKVGLGRGTVLTGGRGVKDQALTQQSRLKTKLG